MDPKSKFEQIRRHLAGAKRARSRDERKLIAEQARRRRLGREPRAPRRREWRDWDDDEAADGDLFEHMTRAAPADLFGVGAREPMVEVRTGEHGLLRGLVLAPRGQRARLALQVPPRGARGGDGGWAGDPGLGPQVDAQVDRSLVAGGLAVGDEVAVETPAPEVWRVVARGERRSVLLRGDPSAPGRERVLAANVDVGVIVVAAGGDRLRTGFVDRVWIALARGGVRALLALNKTDLCDDGAEARRALESARTTYAGAGLEVLAVSALSGLGLDDLVRAIRGSTAVFVGQSGVGKSSLLNALDPGGARAVKGVRAGNGKGRHTTSASTLRELGGGTRVIDTPGVRAFALGCVDPGEVLVAFPDLARHGPDCAFTDCLHAGERGCAVARAAGREPALVPRLAAYRRVLESLGDP